MSAVSAAATLKVLYTWINKQCSYFDGVKQGVLVMMVLPLVFPLHSALSGANTHCW